MKMSGNIPFLTDDTGKRYVGIKHPDGTESVIVFAGETGIGPAGEPSETAIVQWPVAITDTDIAGDRSAIDDGGARHRFSASTTSS